MRCNRYSRLLMFSLTCAAYTNNQHRRSPEPNACWLSTAAFEIQLSSAAVGGGSTDGAAQPAGRTANSLPHFSYRLPPKCEESVAAREVALVKAALVSTAMSSPAACTATTRECCRYHFRPWLSDPRLGCAVCLALFVTLSRCLALPPGSRDSR